MLFISYIVISGVLLHQLNYSVSVNLWDGLFSIFGNGNLLFFVLNVVFLYLISDLLPEKELGQLVLLRLGSRRQWWAGKMITLALLALCYAGINLGIVAGVAIFVLPLSGTWSQAVLNLPLEFYINPRLVEAMSPGWAFVHMQLLLILGWIGLGIWEMVIAQWRQSAVSGFIAAMLFSFGGLMVLRADLSSPLAFLSPHAHFLLNYHAFGESPSLYPPLWLSWLYWAVWIGAGAYAGLKLSVKQDFYRGVDGK